MLIVGNNLNIWPKMQQLKSEGNLNPFDNYSRIAA